MGNRAAAIVWAQWRTLWNYLPRSNKAGLAFSTLFAALWYGSFVLLAIAAGSLMADPDRLDTIAKVLPRGLAVAFMYWQVVPLLLASTGSALDIRKLQVYPVSKRELFALEVLLRISTGLEVVIVFAGAAAGALLNPKIPLWAPISLLVYSLFNLLVSAGVRDLLTRLLARRVVREILVILFVLAAALPQMVVALHPSESPFKRLIGSTSGLMLPWAASATLAMGRFSWGNVVGLFGWTVAAYVFSHWQFERTLRFDPQESASNTRRANGPTWMDALFDIPGRIFRDPMGAMVEKELRSLARSPRFRLVFLMGFSFGLLIWLPVTFGRSGLNDSWMGRNYLAAVSLYALLLLSDTLFWNVFGFDRGSAQLYFLTPVDLKSVLRAKNAAAISYVALDISMVAVICAVLRFPVSLDKLIEAYAVTLVMALLLMAAGNLSSIYNPKPIDPAKSFRSSGTRQTQVMMLVFPAATIPVALAYAARYAFASSLAFWGVLGVDAAFAVVAYNIATDSAVATAERRKESIIDSLSRGEGPVAT